MEELNEKIAGLVKKAEKSGMPYSILKKVYDRGMAAWKTGHRPGTTPQQWAFARVNSFVTKSSGTWGKADKDLADKVRGAKKESIENPKKAKDLIGQVREKLGKDADAGDYIKDFRKSDAPQFKGKSDKKIRDMAIAAYLDDKDKKESIKENLLIHTKDDRVTDQLVYHLRDLQGRGRSNISDIDTDNVYMHRQNKYVKGRINVEIDGSRSDSQKLIKDLQKKYGSKIKVSLDMGEDNLQEQFVFVFRYEYKGKRYAAPFKSEKDAKSSMKAAMKDKNVKNPSITKDILKRGVKFAEDVEIVEFIDEAVLAGRDYNYDGKSPIKISKKMYAKVQRDSKSMIKGKPYMMALNPKTQGTELVPVVFEEVDNLMEFDGIVNVTTRNSNISKQLFHYLRYDIMNDPKIANSIPYDIDLQVDNDSDKDTFFRMYPDMEQRDIKKVVAHLKKKYGSSIKIQLEGVEQEEWMVDENSLAAQASRVISQTAIREKKDPADIDMVATDLDRKAADKNIFVQLKRAQDMKGKGDIEFLDKKKKKVDIRIINKAIDMMMKMKPADRAKMQTAIGKSYRDLLKTVQRGKV